MPAVEPHAACTGTVKRLNTVRHYAVEAGFGKVRILPIGHFFYTFYRLLS
jgi:hypothetical protein